MRIIDPEDGSILTVYEPNERCGGLIWGVKQAWSDIYSSRYAISRLFLRDFVAQFRQRLLGYLWALINPLLGILSFLFLYFTGVLNPGEGDVPYSVYVLLGTSIWTVLPSTVGAVSNGLNSQADLILRTRMPKIALAVSSLASLCYNTLVGMLTILIVFFLAGVTPSCGFILYPLLILPLILSGLAIGLVLAVLSTIAKDLTNLVVKGLGLLMYVTPVVYLWETITNPTVALLIKYNPMTYLVDVPRSMALYGTSPHLQTYLIVAGVMLALVIVAIRIFYLLEDLVAERL